MKSHYSYNSWPLGKLPSEWQRPEPGQLRSLGYEWDDPRDIVDIFERELSSYTGAPNVVLTDCCTNAIFLSLYYEHRIIGRAFDDPLEIPAQTYVSIPMVLSQLGIPFRFKAEEWSGEYKITGTNIWDSAARFTSNMFRGGADTQCLSFQIKKQLPIGRGGAILTENEDFARWAKLASYDGRDLKTPYDSPNHVTGLGWHMYMTPEDAARGILLLNDQPATNSDTMTSSHYPDLRGWSSVNKLQTA